MCICVSGEIYDCAILYYTAQVRRGFLNAHVSVLSNVNRNSLKKNPHFKKIPKIYGIKKEGTVNSTSEWNSESATYLLICSSHLFIQSTDASSVFTM